MIVGLLHPGEMGSALAAVLRARDVSVLWASADRSAETTRRAQDADLEDARTVDEVARRSDIILSVCPPHAAEHVARSVAGFQGVFVDANAVAPATARAIASIVEATGARYVDGGIIGPPPRDGAATRLYLAGAQAPEVAELFINSAVAARVLPDRNDAASALKMVYAAWTKGTAALVLAIRAVARAEGVEETLLDEWRHSLPDLPERSRRAARSAAAKGWRWVAEMEEIASTFGATGLPTGFHQAAAEVFRRPPDTFLPTP